MLRPKGVAVSVVSFVTVEPRLIAAVRRQARFAEIPRVLIAGLDRVWPVIRAMPSRKAGRNVAVYRPLGSDEVEILAGVEIDGRFDDVGEVSCLETPGGQAATATHVGPYDKMGATYDAIGIEVAGKGRRLAGRNFEVYGHWTDDPTKLETEIYMLLMPD